MTVPRSWLERTKWNWAQKKKAYHTRSVQSIWHPPCSPNHKGHLGNFCFSWNHDRNKVSQVLRALGHHHHHLWAQINLCLHGRHQEEESTKWTNVPEGSEANTAPRLTFPLLGIAMESCTCNEGERAIKQFKRGLCSTNNCKIFPNSLRFAGVLHLLASWRWG